MTTGRKCSGVNGVSSFMRRFSVTLLNMTYKSPGQKPSLTWMITCLELVAPCDL
jgi:hypothetical protein